MKVLRAIVRGIARIIAILMIFSIVGPLAFTALIFLISFGLGLPPMDLLYQLARTGSLIASDPVSAVAKGALVAALPPSIITGLVFALAAVCAKFGAISMAWCAVAIAIGIFLLGGVFYGPHHPLVVPLPDVQGAESVLKAFVGLNLLAFLPTAICWWLSRPLHRARIAA